MSTQCLSLCDTLTTLGSGLRAGDVATMLHPRTPLVALTRARRDIGLSLSLRRRVLYAESILSTIPFPSTKVATAIYARDAELIEPLLVTRGTFPTNVLGLRTVLTWTGPRALEAPTRSAEIEQVLVEPASFIRLLIAISAWPSKRILTQGFSLALIAGFDLPPTGRFDLASCRDR